MKLVLISDTHTFHQQCDPLPDGDVLIHAGDLGLEGSINEVQKGIDWLDSQPHEHVILVPGNHDWAFQRYRTAMNYRRINYLENTSVTLAGRRFYGSPITPEFFNWAFMAKRGEEIKRYWDMIPDEDLDVLITHGPPKGILDWSSYKNEPAGCEDLLRQVEITKPLVHVFGHIHGSYGYKKYQGVKFFNASQVNEAYKIVNKPWVVEI